MTPALLGTLIVVGPAVYRPPFAIPPESDVEVPAFRIDATPVVTGAYVAFLHAHPEWKRGRAPLALADAGYLASWTSPEAPGPGADLSAPVTEVSWFAAAAYCESRGARLPTVAQWEVAAAGPADRPDPMRSERILAWYGQPNPERLPPVGRHPPNGWGVYDADDLVWEWTFDFNGAPGGDERVCGAGSVGLRDPADVATLLRYEMRDSLEAAYTTPNLGFRCAMSP